MYLRGRPPTIAAGTGRAGLLIGSFFAAEFLLLFIALDLTTVVRASVIFYSMPIWLALGAHFLIPGERLTGRRALGLMIAFSGVAWAMGDRGTAPAADAASLIGDLCALGAAMFWAGIVLTARSTALQRTSPEMQIFWQVAVSAPLLMLAAPFYGGPFLRDPEPIHWAGFAFLTVGVVSAGFIVWFWLLARYPSWVVASFSFLTPVVAVLMGWLLLGEPVGLSVFAALALVIGGIVLINRPARRNPAPA
jgi:drug/metabolite transporter (DMT)-like permease